MKLTSGTGRALLPSRPAAAPLTLSGNEQTPATRAAGTQGDGLTGPYRQSSIGVWEATTNLVTNGGAETNVTGTTALSSNTIARSTAQAKFGTASFLCTYQDNITVFRWGITLTAAAHSLGMWVYVPTNYDGTALKIGASGFTSATQPADTAVNMSLRDQWQWVKFENFTPDAGDLAGNLNLYESGSVPTAGRFVYVDGVQCEAQPLCTPYVHTDGGTASRSAARPQLPAVRRYVTETQGWFAGLLRMGWASTADIYAGAFPSIFTWRDDSTHEIAVQYDVANDKWSIVRRAAGATRVSETNAQSSAAGDLAFVLCTWTGAALATSTNGGAFNSGADTNVPTMTATFADMGSFGTTLQMDSELLFFALGRGALSNANAAALNNIARNNRIDSRIEDLPGGCTFKWPYADTDWRNGIAL